MTRKTHPEVNKSKKKSNVVVVIALFLSNTYIYIQPLQIIFVE